MEQNRAQWAEFGIVLLYWKSRVTPLGERSIFLDVSSPGRNRIWSGIITLLIAAVANIRLLDFFFSFVNTWMSAQYPTACWIAQLEDFSEFFVPAEHNVPGQLLLSYHLLLQNQHSNKPVGRISSWLLTRRFVLKATGRRSLHAHLTAVSDQHHTGRQHKGTQNFFFCNLFCNVVFGGP